MPIKVTEGRISTSKKASVTPMAKASMEVAMAMGSIARQPKEESIRSHSSHPLEASLIMLPPMSPNRIKAIQ